MSRSTFLLALIVLAVVGAGAYWFVTVYDTAAAKCNRGDLGACTVLAAQEAQEQAQYEAIQAAEAEDRFTRLSYEGGACLLALPENNAAIHFVGPEAHSWCTESAESNIGGYADWMQVGGADAMYNGRMICEADYGDNMARVWDTGGAITGSAVCEEL
jgi:hypothetical protein